MGMCVSKGRICSVATIWSKGMSTPMMQINLAKDDSMTEPGSLDTAGPPATERIRKFK